MFPSVAELPWLPLPPDDFAAQCRAIGTANKPAGPALQFLSGFRLSAQQSTSLYRAIKRCRSTAVDLAPLAGFRLGILTNATFDLLNDCLPAGAARHGVALELVTTPYDQVMQQALDPASEINRLDLDAVLVAVDHRWLNLAQVNLSDNAEQRIAAATQQLRAVIDGLRKNGGAPAILQTVPIPSQTLFGSYDRRVRGTVRSMVEEVNRAIVTLAAETGSYLLDAAALAEQVGSDRWFDPVRWIAYKLPFAAECFPIYADMLGRLLGAIRGKSRKCLVLDLDNTIWGGVIGDDGVEGIAIGQGNPKGEAFLSVQQAALELRERGIMLAACSKNTDAVARDAFQHHPDMLLRESHISVFQANWLDKPSNLEAIARTLNIGLDSLVLLDDNPAERAQVRAALPMVAVPELPNDPAFFAWHLLAAGYFEAVGFSAEDRLRADSYASDAKRADVMAKSRDLGDYLSSLDMVITLTPFDTQGRQRIVQLINKTNQFNLTTRRYTEAEVVATEADESAFTLQVRLADRFGDLGMIGVVICRPADGEATTWDIDTWLMSCRVLGRHVEQAMLGKVVTEARRRGIHRLVGRYIPTSKNSMVADHYAKLGFQGVGSAAGAGTAWTLAVEDYSIPCLPMRIAGESTPLSDAAE
jgi:FkbH-like protein